MMKNQTSLTEVAAKCREKSKETLKDAKSSNSSMKNNPPSTTGSVLEKKDAKSEKSEEEKKENNGKISTPLEEIKRNRKKEIMTIKEKTNAERESFVKEMSNRKEKEREEIIKEARRLLFYRKPMCRRLNRAFLVSESLRELDAQVEFQKSIKDIDQERENFYADLIKTDIAKYEEEQKVAAAENLKKMKKYAANLKKQIEMNAKAKSAIEKEEYELEKEDRINTNKYLDDIKEYEAEQKAKKRDKLQQALKESLEDKKQFNLEMKRDEEFVDRFVEIHEKAKMQVRKMTKEMGKKDEIERLRVAKVIGDQYTAVMQSRKDTTEENFEKAVKEHEALANEKQKTRADRRSAMRAAIEAYRIEVLKAKEREAREENELKMWDMMQRIKRDELNKQYEDEERRHELSQKLKYARLLKEQLEDQEKLRLKEASEEALMGMNKSVIEVADQGVLAYAEEILQESKDVRPLYPILKAIEECKKEMGMAPVKPLEEIVVEDTNSKRKRGIRRVCTTHVPENEIYYLG